MADLDAATRVLQALRHGPITIAELATRTELSPDKAARLVADLEHAGWTFVRGELVHEGGGRPAATLQLTRASVLRLLGWARRPG